MYLKPQRTPGGQRRYRSKDIEVIEKIKHLRYKERYTIAGTIKELRSSRKTTEGKNLDVMVDEIAEMIRERVLEKIGNGTGE